jgi:hypothetical protein
MSAVMQMVLSSSASFGVGGTWSFVGQSTAATGSNPTITLPVGIASGDLILISVSASIMTTATASGYSVAYQNYNNGAFDTDAVLLYKVASGTEGGTGVSVTTDAIIEGSSAATVYRPSGTITLGPVSGSEIDGNPSITNPSLTIEKDALIIVFNAFRRGTSTGSVVIAPSGVTARHNLSSGVSYAGFWLGEVYAESTPTTEFSSTMNSAVNLEVVAVTAAFYSS